MDRRDFWRDHVKRRGFGGVCDDLPEAFGQIELERLFPGVHRDIEARAERAVVELESEGMRVGVPVGLVDMDAVEADVVRFGMARLGVGEHRVSQGLEAIAQGDHFGAEIEHFCGLRRFFPVDPRDFVVLAEAVVVAALRAPDFVAAEHHGGAARDEERGDEIFGALDSLAHDDGIVCFPFDAEVRARVVFHAVSVLLTVSLVVLVEIAAEVAEREAVMRRDEIDALRGVGLVCESVFAACYAAREREGGVVVTEPEAACVIAEFAVPFGPCFREAADLVEPAGIPCLCDELASAQDGIVGDIAEQPEIRVIDPFAFV